MGNILSFEKEFPDAKVIKLEQNYRSTETILEAANAVIAHNRARRAKNLWSRNGPGRAVDWFVTGYDEHEAKEAVGLVRHIRSKTGAAYRSFAVLYRSNQQSRPFEIALRQAAIPYTVFGGPEFFDRVEVKDLLAYLKIIANPRDEPSLLRVVNVPRRGTGDATLHRVHEICRQQDVSTTKGLRLVLEGGGLASNTAAGVREFLGLVSQFRKRLRDCGGRVAGTAMDLVDATRYRDEVARAQRHVALFEALSRERRGRRRMTRTSRFVAEMPQERVKQRTRAARDMAAADSAHTRS